MKKCFTEEQIIGALKEAEAGMPVKELCRKDGLSPTRYLCLHIAGDIPATCRSGSSLGSPKRVALPNLNPCPRGSSDAMSISL